MAHTLQRPVIGVIGLGYVGLPLAVSFARHYDVVGFDINPMRVDELKNGYDRTREVTDDELHSASRLAVTTEQESLRDVGVYIVTTPTPIDAYNQPDLEPVLSATRTVAATMSMGDLVIYESTVYPGATEEECVPLLESGSGLAFNREFFVGYSPERINPGDKEHRFETICKVTSGSTPEAAHRVDALYRKVVTAGTHLAPSIKVAEAAKVIENTQRDVNIALVNELALIFNRLGIDTHDVLDAASTKWNFLPFKPGLVGGHCIGVDPYYLTHKAESIGYHPEIILAGRRLNDSMGSYVATELVRAMIRAEVDLRGARVLVLGLTFKENTPDLRNSKVFDIITALRKYGIDVDVYDPWVDGEEAARACDLNLISEPSADTYDGVVLAVAHEQFRELGAVGLSSYAKKDRSVLYDLKNLLPRSASVLRL